MYNRYIPQPDGSYQRSRMPDPSGQQRPMPRREPPAPQNQPPAPEPCTPPPRPHPSCGHIRPPRPQYHPSRPTPQKDGGIGGFLRQLLPKNVNTEDLLIILLLLLMSGDCAEDQNTALLTLAIYLFL